MLWLWHEKTTRTHPGARHHYGGASTHHDQAQSHWRSVRGRQASARCVVYHAATTCADHARKGRNKMTSPFHWKHEDARWPHLFPRGELLSVGTNGSRNASFDPLRWLAGFRGKTRCTKEIPIERPTTSKRGRLRSVGLDRTVGRAG